MAGRKERERGVSELVSNELGHWCPASPARAAERGFSRSIAFEAAAYQHQLQGWWLEPLVSLQWPEAVRVSSPAKGASWAAVSTPVPLNSQAATPAAGSTLLSLSFFFPRK